MADGVIESSKAPVPGGGYSQARKVQGFLYTAGFGPHDAEGVVVGEDIEEQTAQTLENIAAVLTAAGFGLDDVVKSTVHLQHLERDFPGFDRVYRDVMPTPYPARTTVGSQLANILVEIDVVAHKSEDHG